VRCGGWMWCHQSIAMDPMKHDICDSLKNDTNIDRV
jgi:hypothetical protein